MQFKINYNLDMSQEVVTVRRRRKIFIYLAVLCSVLFAATLAWAEWNTDSRIEDMIVFAPNPVLRQIAKPIDKHDTETIELLKEMADYLDDGLTPKGGLALPQLGISKRGFVVMIDDDPVIMINPQVSFQGNQVPSLEGCLSIPDTFGYVHRWENVTVSYRDENWATQSLALDDIESFAVQHEHDHLNGILITDNFLPNKYNDPEKDARMLD